MPLSESEIIKVREKSKTLLKGQDNFDYTYDIRYGCRYSLNDVNSVLKNVNLSLSLYEINLLTYDGRFQITKKTIVALGKSLLIENTVSDDNTLKYGILILLWGYASQGYGVFRINKILKDPSNVEQFSKNIVQSLSYLQKDDIKNVYLCWSDRDTKISGLGESFFTKILYFLSKIIDESNPKVLIKDSFTSMNSAIFFEINRLNNRSENSFFEYISVLRLAANELNTTPEKIEEYLFSNTKRISLSIDKNELLEHSFNLFDNFMNEYNPPVVWYQTQSYDEVIPDDKENYYIMLVADGKPKDSIPEMTYDSKMGNVQDEFYSGQRSRIIRDANIEANKYYKHTATYILTTGYGPVPISANIPLYNIPGEIAITNPMYWNLYIDSLKKILPNSEVDKKIRVSIVYYAGKSKKNFRDGINKIVKEITEDNYFKHKYDIHFCMYGCRQHSVNRWNGNWGSLTDIYKCLSSLDIQTLEAIKKGWIEENVKISPFFTYF